MEDSRYTKLIDHVILEQLGKGKTFTFKVTGDSMHPLIRKGDPITIGQCKPTDLSMGDIITFRSGDLCVTHRVLWIKRKGDGIRLITKGDNEITLDPPILPNHVVGNVVAIQRGNQTLHLDTRYWRFINRLLGMVFLGETISIVSYRFVVRKIHPFRAFLVANHKRSHLYRRLKNRGLGFATRIIM